jgi:hypothetical protein
MSLPSEVFLVTNINAQSMASNITSTGVNLDSVSRVAIQAAWSGTSPVGAINVLGSNDDSTYSSIATNSVSTNTGDWLVNIENPAFRFVKVTYTATSGTGSLTATISGKI